jgi:two-component system sensor histidine kinase RegB
MQGTFRSFFQPPITADGAQNTAKLIWLVRLRWLALAAQALSIVPALEFQVLEPRLVAPFAGIVAALGILNLVTWLRLRAGARGSQRQILLQLTADIAVLSALLSLSGGAWNPLVPILFVHSMLGAMLLEGRTNLLFVVLLIVSLGLIQANSVIPPGLEGALLPATILFPAQFLLALVFWILTAWLSRTVAALQRNVAMARERKTRIDRLRAVGALAAGLSHEFATPLNTAQLKLSRLARNDLLKDNADLETAREELERCGDVLRRMAGAQLKPDRLNLEIVDVAALGRQVCNSLTRVHEGTPLNFSCDTRVPLLALLPPVAFSQGLINLIDNAVESAGADQPVEVRVGRAGERVEISVLDHGEGWPLVVRTHLGEPFVTTKPDGVGLGLYYVHNLAEAIGAELSLVDRPEGGAIAHLSLPMAPEPTIPSRIGQPHHARALVGESGLKGDES